MRPRRRVYRRSDRGGLAPVIVVAGIAVVGLGAALFAGDKQVKEAFQAAFQWIWGKLWGMVAPLLESLGVPTAYLQFPDVPEAWMPVLRGINLWFPLQEGLFLAGIFCSFYATITVVKLTLKLIPGLNF